jgi:hypothetical protein
MVMGCQKAEPDAPEIPDDPEISGKILATDLRFSNQSLRLLPDEIHFVVYLQNIGEAPVVIDEWSLGENVTCGVRLWRVHTSEGYAVRPAFPHVDGDWERSGVTLPPGGMYLIEQVWPMRGERYRGYYLRVLPDGELDTSSDVDTLPSGDYAVDLVRPLYVRRGEEVDYHQEVVISAGKAWIHVD